MEVKVPEMAINVPPALVNWKTSLLGAAPLLMYALQYFGWWPSIIPLPPFHDVWPVVVANLGLGFSAKDHNITGGTRQQ